MQLFNVTSGVMGWNDLITGLLEAGYRIDLEEGEFDYWSIRGNNIRGGWAEVNTESYECLSGALVVDHEDCFDKWSKCPMRVDITGEVVIPDIIAALQWLGSDEGFDWSNSYDYLCEPKTFGTVTIGCAS